MLGPANFSMLMECQGGHGLHRKFINPAVKPFHLERLEALRENGVLVLQDEWYRLTPLGEYFLAFAHL